MSPPADERVPRGTAVFPGLVQVHFDGACEPAHGGGIATYGFVAEGEGLRHEEGGLAVPPWSRHATNNVAEYAGAIRALEWLVSRGYAGPVLVLGDSQLVIRQMNGEYEVRAEHLKQYHQHLHALAGRFAEVRFAWVPRAENARADALTKEALAAAFREAQRHRPDRPVVTVDEDFERDAGGSPPP